jgi:hypothetical protein
VQRVADAFEYLFRPEEESAYLFWHGIPVRIRYRQDLPVCFDNILAMTWLLGRDEAGASFVDLETHIVSARLELRWRNDDCHIRAAFKERRDSHQLYAEALNRHPELHMSKAGFLREWRTLLHQIIAAVEAGRIGIEDGVERRKWEMLQRVDRQVPGWGRMYELHA